LESFWARPNFNGTEHYPAPVVPLPATPAAFLHLISAIIPVYNGAAFVRDAVDSALLQRDTHVIAVNDGSTDQTAAVLQSYGDAIRVLHTANGGAAAARNVGVAAAESEFLAFLDADDTWLPGKHSLQLAALRDTELDAVFAHSTFMSMAGDERNMPGLILNTMLIRASVFRRIGPFDVRLATGEFIEWFARATDAGLRWAMLPECVASRRAHPDNMTRQGGTARGSFPATLHAILKRRRERGGGTA
jgi:glycosyltransferase involved in cell wall biosynthesis